MGLFLRIFRLHGGRTSRHRFAIEWAVDNDMDVNRMRWGRYGSRSVQDAIPRTMAAKAGIIVVSTLRATQGRRKDLKGDTAAATPCHQCAEMDGARISGERRESRCSSGGGVNCRRGQRTQVANGNVPAVMKNGVP